MIGTLLPHSVGGPGRNHLKLLVASFNSRPRRRERRQTARSILSPVLPPPSFRTRKKIYTRSPSSTPKNSMRFTKNLVFRAFFDCHRNFGPGKNGPRTKFFNENFGPPGPLFPKKMVQNENFGPGVAVYSTGRVSSFPSTSIVARFTKK